MPTDRAVAVGRDDDPPIPAGVDGPNLVSTLPSPSRCSGVVERGEGEARAEEEALGVRSDRDASCTLVRVERDRPGVQRWVGFVAMPAIDRQAFAYRRERQTVVRCRT